MNLLSIFLNNLLPVLLLAALGFGVQRLLRIDPRPLSQIVFYVFSPALVFTLLVAVPFDLAQIGRMALLVLAILAVLGLVAWGLARWLRLSRTMTSAVVLCITFMNAGNLGLPVTQLAFGELTLAWASVFFATTSLAANSAGAWIASLGRTDPWRAFLGLAKVPAVYAIPAALIFHERGIALPDPLMTPIRLLSAATIPSMLLILGMQLAVNGRPIRPRVLFLTTLTRLILSPLLAWAFLALLRLPTEAAHATILEAAMPTAVLTSILASQFEVEPEFVSGSILMTTLLSPLTLSAVLYLLQR